MTTVEDLMKVVFVFEPIIRRLFDEYKYDSYANYELEVDLRDPNSVFCFVELYEIIVSIEYLIDRICYLKRPVKAEGFLHKGPDGYFLIEDVQINRYDEIEVCREREVFIKGRRCKIRTWDRDTIEYENGDCYLISHKNLSIEGIEARIREPIQK